VNKYNMNNPSWATKLLAALGLLLSCCTSAHTTDARQFDSTAILNMIDAAVKARFDGIRGYTDTEHYAVFRGGDEVHPTAEMTVKTIYNRDTGKSYEILSASGSSLIRNLVLSSVLDNEKHVNEPGVREGTWINTANYEMSVKPGGLQSIDGRNCVALSIKPRRKEPYLLDGTLWVDAEDGRIVHIEGMASKSSSVFTGPTRMMRQYVDVGGFAQATHARAESDSGLFGQTVVTIDYRDYQIQFSQPR
jgi:outer membrane lipoprotein-sorting protein